MTLSSLIAIIIGVAGAVLGVYFRESVRRAYRQKQIATKLEAQLTDLLRELISGPFLSFLTLASVWDKERLEALKLRGTQGFIEVEQKYKQKLEEVRRAIEAGSHEIDSDLAKLHASYRAMPQRPFDYHIKNLELARDSLFSGRSLITDDEAAELSWDTAARIVAFRTHAIKLIHQSISLFLALREMEQLDVEGTRALLSPFVESATRLSLEIEPFRRRAETIRKSTPLRLAFEIAAHGS